MHNPPDAPAPRSTSLIGVWPYGLAVLTTAAAAALTRFTWPLFAGTPFAPLFGAVAITSHWGNGQAGLVAVLLAAAGATFAFPAEHAWAPRALVTFIPVAAFASLMIAGRNRTAAALRASEAELRATLEHVRESEQRVRRAQKMEAVGQLVAGVAHNFNNLLTVTMGYTDVLLERHPDPGPDHTNLREIRNATERGAALTRQLLAFGRDHDSHPARVDLNGIVAGLLEMLTRVIREDIVLTLDVEPTPVAVVIDPHDIEQVILNLVLNARDALPSGGAIHIDVDQERIDATSSPPDVAVTPGDYVRLRVRDNGVGMTPDVQAHLFEPFFTTKEVGQGTGLGLAFVHEIARNAGGFVTVETAPGKGTTVSVHLPPAPEPEILGDAAGSRPA